MSRWIRLMALALVAGALACSDQPPAGQSATGPSAAEPGAGATAPALNTRADPDHARLQQLARRVALSLQDPAVRAELRSELNRSPFAEHKLQFQRLIHGNGAIRSAIARASHLNDTDVSAEADGAMALELYFPVPAHRAAWDGGTDLLVATEVADHETPVAFDVNGKRHLLDPNQPPATPVLALVPQETNFDAAAGPAFMACQDCGGETGGGGTSGGDDGGGWTGSSTSQTALFLTRAQFVGDFEGWLKGNPEFEIHIMGPASGTDTTTLISYQCIGEHAPAGYVWDMNSTSWTGTAKLFTFAQMDAFSQAHPGQAYLIYALEDDDTACSIKTDENRLADVLSALGKAYQDYKGAKDQKVFTSGGAQRIIKAAKSGGSFLSALYSWIKSNDDVIGFAISDAVSGRYHSGTNWTVIGKDMAVNGWFNLEMR